MKTDFPRTLPASHQLLVALRSAIVFLAVCGLGYTGLATLLGGLFFPDQAIGSLILHEGRTVGSSLVAQPFASPGYFYARPSAAGFDPTVTGGSNLAPSNPQLRERVREDSVRIQALEGIQASAVPVDLVAASGAGLDPHISPAAARIQAPRVAAARGLPESRVIAAIEEATEGPQWGVFGQPRVNVLLLNLALDQQLPSPLDTQ